MFLCFIISSSSWLDFIRHIPFSLFGPKIFLSNTNTLLIMVSFNIHVSHEYVTIGLITVYYNFNFALFDISLLSLTKFIMKLIWTGLWKCYVILYPIFLSVLMEDNVLRNCGLETFAVCHVSVVIRAVAIVAVEIHVFCVTSVHLCTDKLAF